MQYENDDGRNFWGTPVLMVKLAQLLSKECKSEIQFMLFYCRKEN